MKRICLSIGVSRAERLEPLPGAITAAREIGEWAHASGFDAVEVVTDEDRNAPVTIKRLREKLDGLLVDDGEGIDTFILHFSGHGFRGGAEQNLWFPTDWLTELRAIGVEILKAKLYRHGIVNLTIFSDACRSLPGDIMYTELSVDGILGNGPYDRVAPTIDRFSAAADGHRALMVPGATPQDARCVFTTALLEALWGHRDDAFDKYVPGKVTPESLALFLKSRLAEIGVRYGVKCEPESFPGVPKEHLIYYDRGRPPATSRTPPEWPEPQPLAVAADNLKFHYDEQLIAKLDVRDVIAFHLDKPAILISRPKPSTNGSGSRFPSRVRSRFRLPPDGLHDPDINLLVEGGEVRQIWIGSWCRVDKVRHSPTATEFSVQFEDKSAQVLIEFVDGTFASALIFPELVTILSVGKSGVIGWLVIDQRDRALDQMNASLTAIAKLGVGNLTARDADRLAVKLRRGKHANPTLGALSSYLYDYTGDIDSIRRMAYFYARKRQPMPFDVAFMGLLNIGERPHSDWVDVPAVSARKRGEGDPRLPSWAKSETPAITGEVAGMWPIFRQGWAFMDSPEPSEKAASSQLHDLSRYLLPSPFTSFNSTGGRAAIEMFNLRECL